VLVPRFILALLAAIRVFFRSHGDTAPEVLASDAEVVPVTYAGSGAAGRRAMY
jgi:hypothetical protein